MIDTLNALQSYLDTIYRKGFFYSLLINNGHHLRVYVSPNRPDKMKYNKFFIQKKYNEQGISEILERVEEYVESKN